LAKLATPGAKPENYKKQKTNKQTKLSMIVSRLEVRQGRKKYITHLFHGIKLGYRIM
jgi:hypothetical protein